MMEPQPAGPAAAAASGVVRFEDRPVGRRNASSLVGITMILLAICLLIGMALGQRFSVFILVPATALALMAAIGAGLAGHDDGCPVGHCGRDRAPDRLLFETALQLFAGTGPAHIPAQA